MTPVDQTILHDPDSGAIGNCMQAAVATLLDLQLNAVPHFAATDNWVDLFTSWLRDRRIICVHIGLLDLPDDMPCLLVGTSPRGVEHMVVGLGTDVAHDPHPSRDGLVAVKSAWVLCPYLPAERAA